MIRFEQRNATLGLAGSFFVLLMVLLGARPARADDLLLVDDGKPRSVIVLPSTPSASAARAATVLRDHICAISGATLAIIPESSLGEVTVQAGTVAATKFTNADVFLFVGAGASAAKLGVTSDGLAAGGVRIRTFNNAIVLLGPDEKTPTDPAGSLHAVVTFLEERLGCRYLWPGPGGKVIPHHRTIRVAAMSADVSPKVLQRRIRDVGYGDRLKVGLDRLGVSAAEFLKWNAESRRADPADPDWMTWNYLGGTMDLKSGHAFGDYWKRFGKDHPDWFALQPNGSRDQSLSNDRARLCDSNLELIENIAREKIAELDNDRTHHSVSIAPNDGGRTTFCMCDRCKKLDPPEGRKVELLYDDATGGKIVRRTFPYVSLTDRTIYFYNAIAERVVKAHPEAVLCADAYSFYSAPPVHAKLHPSVVIRFVPMSYTNEEARRSALDDYQAWSTAATKVFFRPNFVLEGRRVGTDLVYVHRMAQDIRHLASHGMIATDFDACLNSWATTGLNYYVLARLLWNPDLDVDHLIDDYCTAGFGPAAGAVKEYFLAVEKLTDEMATKKLKLTAPFTPEVSARLRAMLTKADQLAKDDATLSPADSAAIRTRVEFLRIGLEFTAIQASAYALLDQDPRPAPADVKALLHDRAAMMRDIIEHHHMAVNVGYAVWGEGHPWVALGWAWENEPGLHPKPKL